MQKIIVRGARQHNLRDLNLEIPRNRLCVVTGLRRFRKEQSRL